MSIHGDIKAEAERRYPNPEGLALTEPCYGVGDIREAYFLGACHALGHPETPIPPRVALVAQMAAGLYSGGIARNGPNTAESVAIAIAILGHTEKALGATDAN